MAFKWNTVSISLIYQQIHKKNLKVLVPKFDLWTPVVILHSVTFKKKRIVKEHI